MELTRRDVNCDRQVILHWRWISWICDGLQLCIEGADEKEYRINSDCRVLSKFTLLIDFPNQIFGDHRIMEICYHYSNYMVSLSVQWIHGNGIRWSSFVHELVFLEIVTCICSPVKTNYIHSDCQVIKLFSSFINAYQISKLKIKAKILIHLILWRDMFRQG